ncbi:MAG: hypothetical protein RIM84_25550 [Alphaproteobacteria bacterium]
MAGIDNEWAEPGDDGWLLITVALPPADNHGGFSDRKRGLLLHVLEAWLADHHRVPALLPGTRGRRNSDAVTVGFRQDEAETALAFRNFCNEIGVGPGLSQSRVFPNHCARTTPRQRSPLETRT